MTILNIPVEPYFWASLILILLYTNKGVIKHENN